MGIFGFPRGILENIRFLSLAIELGMTTLREDGLRNIYDGSTTIVIDRDQFADAMAFDRISQSMVIQATG